MAPQPSSRKAEQKGIVRRLEVVLQSAPQSAELAETLLAQFCEQAGCSEQQQSEISLAVRESVVNAVMHGNRGQLRKKVFVSAELSRSGLRVCVRDQGKGFNPAEVPDPRKPENLLRESGRGILLMQELMDRVAIRRARPQGMEVRMTKLLPRRLEEKAAYGVSVRRSGDVAIVDLSGRIVLGDATEALRERLEELIRRGRKKLLLNLGGISYMDSSGLGVLVSCFTSLAHQQGQLKLVNLPKKVHDLLKITKLIHVFDVHQDEAAALRAFR